MCWDRKSVNLGYSNNSRGLDRRPGEQGPELTRPFGDVEDFLWVFFEV